MPKIFRKWLLAALCPALIPALGPIGAAGATVGGPAPHRAVYHITLTSAKRGSGIASVKGEMAEEWSESCDGWTLDHRSLFDITYSPGLTVRITSTVATWESRNGLDYRFNIKNAANGEITENFEGRATLRSDGGGGRVNYTAPKRREEILPPTTIFPMTHTTRVLKATARSPTIFSMVVFDGLSEQGLYRISAVIGQPKPGSPDHPKSLQGLRGKRSWPLQLAYFKLGSRKAEPEHEIGMRLFEHGVGDNLVLDFGEFKVRASLVRLELGNKPSCGA